jgi:hypothetical protein
MDDKVQISSGLDRPATRAVETTTHDLARSGHMEWGAASLALGAIFGLMVPEALMLVYTLESTHYEGFSKSDQRLVAVGGYVSGLLILALVAMSLGFGLRSLVAARLNQRPIALGLAGVLLNGFNIFLWLAALLAWHMSVWSRL